MANLKLRKLEFIGGPADGGKYHVRPETREVRIPNRRGGQYAYQVRRINGKEALYYG